MTNYKCKALENGNIELIETIGGNNYKTIIKANGNFSAVDAVKAQLGLSKNSKVIFSN